MNRRGFFATLAALCAAPAALFRAPKAKRFQEIDRGAGSVPKVVKHPEYFEERDHYYGHEHEWRDLPERAAQQCLVCGDTRSKMRAIEVDDYFELVDPWTLVRKGASAP